MSNINTSIRQRIVALEKQREGMSHGSFDYPRITAEIQALAAQLQPEPHWTSIGGFIAAVASALAACAAAYFGYIQLHHTAPTAHQAPTVSDTANKSPTASPPSPSSR